MVHRTTNKFNHLDKGATGCAYEAVGRYKRSHLLYYIIWRFKKKKGRNYRRFSKRFNKMYGRIHGKIKPSETSAKLTYANSFDHEFSLNLRERISVTLLNMQ